MYNSNWEASKDIITGLELYRIDNVIKYLHAMRDFIIITPGKFSDSRVPVLKSDYTPSKYTRFPEDTLFLSEGYGDWSQYYNHLLLCISAMLNHNRLVRGYTHFSTAGQTEEFALELIAKVFETIYDNTFCMNRTVFESRYCLEWYSPDSPQARLQNRDSTYELMEKIKSSSDKNNDNFQQENESRDGESKENEGSGM